MILEWEAKMRKRFYEWASEYIDSLDITAYSPVFILSFLVENNVFTFKEIRAELDQRKIILRESEFELARQLCVKRSEK